MPAEITIPISTFELAIAYDKPAIKLLADRALPVQALFAALAPWGTAVDDMEVVNAGKPSEQGVRIKIPSRSASFFFGAAGCRFTKDAANWSEADEILKLIDTLLTALAESTGVKFGKFATILSLHLQLKTVSFKDVLRKFIVPEILNLEPTASEAMAMLTRWPKRRITIDGSAALANGIYVQTEREFEADTDFNEMKRQVFEDEVGIFKLLDVEEVDL